MVHGGDVVVVYFVAHVLDVDAVVVVVVAMVASVVAVVVAAVAALTAVNLHHVVFLDINFSLVDSPIVYAELFVRG